MLSLSNGSGSTLVSADHPLGSFTRARYFGARSVSAVTYYVIRTVSTHSVQSGDSERMMRLPDLVRARGCWLMSEPKFGTRG